MLSMDSADWRVIATQNKQHQQQQLFNGVVIQDESVRETSDILVTKTKTKMIFNGKISLSETNGHINLHYHDCPQEVLRT